MIDQLVDSVLLLSDCILFGVSHWDLPYLVHLDLRVIGCFLLLQIIVCIVIVVTYHG